MSNSNLVNYTKLSPHTRTRAGTISKITIHHMAGAMTVEQCGTVFQGERVASSHYGIDSSGRIGQYADEKYRTVTSSSTANDNVAVNIEVSNSATGGNWLVADIALATVIDLCEDICRRNGIAKLNYTGDSTGNLTRHDMFAATECPGPYLRSKFPYIADEVNKRLAGAAPSTATLYRVRKSWADVDSQIGAWVSLDSAKTAADVAPGYKVYDEAGKVIYDPSVAPVPTPEPVSNEPSPWAKEACDAAVSAGLFVGDGRGNFGWQEPVTREALAVVLARAGVIGGLRSDG